MPTTVTSKIGATNSPTTMDYSTLQAWEDACPANLVTDDKIWKGECYDQGEFVNSSGNSLLIISGETTDTTRYIMLVCTAGASFKDKSAVRSTPLCYDATKGVALRCTSAYRDVIQASAINYTRLDGLQIKAGTTTSAAVRVGNGTVSNCIIESTGTFDVIIGASLCTNTLIIHSGSGAPSQLVTGQYPSSSYHGCTLVKTAGVGTSTGFRVPNYGGMVIKNCAVFGCGAFLAFGTGGANATGSDYNATDLASAVVGTHNLTNLKYAKQFVSTTVDFRPLPSGSLVRAGVADATNIPADISGKTRDASMITIGCWETTVTVSKIGATNSPTTMDYSTLQAWEDACPANLTTSDVTWKGECYDQGEFTVAGTVLTISGETVDVTRHIILTCATGASFKDKAGVRTTALDYNASNGVAIRKTAAYGDTVINNVQYTRITGLQIKCSGGNGLALNLGNGTYGDCIVDSCILYSVTSLGSAVVSLTYYIGGINVIKNSLIIGSANTALCVIYEGAAYGCTCIHLGGTGTNYSTTIYSHGIIKNCAGFGAGAFHSGTPSGSSGYNATDQTSAAGSNNQTSLTFANQFVSTTADFRAVSTGSLDLNGTPDTTNLTVDISNYTRSVTTPTIGCWEVAPFVAASFPVKPLSIPPALLCM